MGILRYFFGETNSIYQSAALKIIWNRYGSFPFHTMPSYLDGSVEKCDHELDRLRAARRDIDIIPESGDGKIRRELFLWFDYFEREIKENRRDCETQKSKNSLDNYRKRAKEESDRVAALLESLK